MAAAVEPLKPKDRLKEITSEASDIELYTHLPIKMYIRSASQLFYIAGVYELDNDVEMAFCYYTRYIVLLVEHLPHHPEYKKLITEQANEHQKMMKSLEVAFKSAERLKEILLSLFEMDYVRSLQKAEEEEQEEEQKRPSLEDKTIDVATDDRLQGNGEPWLEERVESPVPSPAGAVVPDRRTKPNLDRPVLSARYGLRPVLVPRTLVEQFLSVSASNTKRDVETCGVLAGKLIQNRFIVTHVIVPKQSGTSNSCLTRSEEEIFTVQDKFNVITLGWIHTHPSQTAFLSSVDLHTHCSYQLMFPEAVAVVCAPKHNQIGMYMLTPLHGLRVVARCRRSGFHPHGADGPLFETCEHASLTDSMDGMLIDLR